MCKTEHVYLLQWSKKLIFEEDDYKLTCLFYEIFLSFRLKRFMFPVLLFHLLIIQFVSNQHN